ACSTTHVTSSWKDPSAAQANLQKVLVVAMVPQETVRRNLEQEMVARLQQRGVQAVPSNQFIQEGSSITRDGVKQVVENNGFDAVLVTQYLGTQRELEYYPGTYYDYFGYYSPMVYDSGYVRETTTVKLESRLFDAKEGGRLLWSAATSTVDPSSAEKAIPTVAQKIVEKLEKDVRI
ncbi:MAG TPA: hypothetical protein VIG99_03980, partial [Myxococcaceae bacterium]